MPEHDLLHDLHAAKDAYFIPYGPDDTPVHVVETFGDLDMEYAALRKGAVIFDMPHRGILRITGTDRLAFLNNMVTRKTTDLTPGTCRSCFWLNRKGRIDTDLQMCEYEDRMLIALDRYLAPQTSTALDNFIFAEDVQIADDSNALHQLAIHGPTSLAFLSRACGSEIDLASSTCAAVSLANTHIWIRRSDLTGEIGIELFIPSDQVRAIYTHLLDIAEKNPELRVRESGWLAINAARIESGHPMFNIDYGTNNLPAESGVINAMVDFDKGCYLGQEVVARMHARNTRKQVVAAIRIEGQQITTTNTDIHQPTTGSPVYVSDESPSDPIGAITSSTISPMLGAIPVCFAMLKDAHAGAGTKLRVLAEGTLVDAVVQPQLAFYSKPTITA